MYILSKHTPPDYEAMLQIIRENPLSIVVRSIQGDLVADHIPLILANDSKVLRGHVARSNPLAQEKIENSILAIFNGPEAYISPSWCASKINDPAIVPTWNYVVVQAKGKLLQISDKAWLIEHLSELSNHNEKAVGQAWQISDAPKEYLDNMTNGIVGIEIEITELVGKWKTTLIKPEENISTVAAALRSQKNNTEMANLIEQRGSKKC